MRKDYLAFFTSLFLSRLADQILLFIVPLVVFQTTNSASLAGLAFFAESLPRFLAFPVCGALCDRYPPMKVLHISQAYRALLCVLATGLYLIFGGITWLVVLSALCGVLTTQGVMAREVVMPHIFKHYSYTKTLSYSQIADQTGLVLGPVVAALLLELSQWHWVVLATGGLFLLADLAMWLWQRLTDVSWTMFAQKPGIWVQPVRIALRHIREQPELRKVITLAVGVNLIVGVTLATSAAMVIGQFHADKDDYATLQAAGCRCDHRHSVLFGTGGSAPAGTRRRGLPDAGDRRAHQCREPQSCWLCSRFSADCGFRQDVQCVHAHDPAAGYSTGGLR
ncbi:MFS transporter [Enterobacterales bacterium BD_CKDN230030183-1A_HGKHYDSX7]